MTNRKIAIAGFVIGLAVTTSPLFAQDQGAQPTGQSADQSQEGMVSIIIGSDVFVRAATSFDAGDYEKAVQDYSLFILLNPTFSEAYHMRGLAYARLNDLDRALADLNQSLDYPQASEQLTGQIYSDRALVYLQQNNPEAALKDLDASVAAAPELPDAYVRRARFFLLNEQFEDALKDYDKLVELIPDDMATYAGRAYVNTRLNHLDDALADYDHMIELDPNNADVYAQRAILKGAQGKYDAALVDWNAAIKINPDDPSLYLQRGLLNYAMRNDPAAAADYLTWIRKQEVRSVDGDPLLPGESQVLPMQQGLSYDLPFRAEAGQKITLTASGRENSQTDPLIVLLDPTSQPIAANDDASNNTYNSAIANFVVPASGTFTLIVSHAGGSPDGAVRVLLQVE